MKNMDEFDFEKHYGDEKEVPPSFFWDELEKQLPKQEKKKKRVVWPIYALGVAVSLVAIVGMGYWFMSDGNSQQPQQAQNNSKPQTNINVEEENRNSGEGIEEKQVPQLNGTPTKNSKAQNNAASTANKYEKNVSWAFAKPTKTKEDVIENASQSSKYPSTLLNKKEISLPVTYRPLELVLVQPANSVIEPSGRKEVEDERFGKMFLNVSGVAHTRSFNRFNKGFKIGVGYTDQITTKVSYRAGLSYFQMSNPGLKRSSLQEHYFITRTSTLQELEITKLHYLTSHIGLQYQFKNTQFFVGIEALMLLNTEANLRTVRTEYGEERVSEKDNLGGYNKGIRKVVPLLFVGISQEVTKKLSISLQFSHSLTQYGNNTVFTNGNSLKLSYMAIGVNWNFLNIKK